MICKRQALHECKSAGNGGHSLAIRQPRSEEGARDPVMLRVWLSLVMASRRDMA
ncbi:hypothetical protein ACU8V3_14655 [Cobetia marina]